MSYAEYLQEKQQGRATAPGEDSEIARFVRSLDVASLLHASREAGIATLHRNGIFTVEDWHLCKKEPLVGEGLSARLRVALNEARPIVAAEEAKSTTEPDNEEDAEQKRIVAQFAEWLKEGKTNKVIVKVSLNSLTDFDTAESHVHVDIGVQLWFHDEKHIGAPEGDPDYDSVFKPEIEFVGSRKMKIQVCPEQGGSYYIREEYRPYGIVNFYQRYKGFVHQELDFHQFPFDTQIIRVRFGATLWGAEQFEMVDFTDPSMIANWHHSALHALHEWTPASPISIVNELEFNLEDRRDISYTEVRVPLQRQGGFFIYNVFVIVYLISVLSWFQFLLEPRILDQRLVILITCFLTLIAINFVVSENVPRVNHFTVLTVYFMLAYASYAIAAIEAGVSFIIFSYLPEPDTATTAPAVPRADTAAPEGLASYAFRSAKILDWTMMGVFAFFQTLLLLVYVIKAKIRFSRRYQLEHSEHHEHEKTA